MITLFVVGATGWMLHRGEIEKLNVTIMSLEDKCHKASQAEAKMREEVASIHAKERAQQEREILVTQKQDEFARIKAQQDLLRGSLTKGLSGKVDGALFSYENVNWRMSASGLELMGDMRNETEKDWYSAVFDLSLYDASDRSIGKTWFYVTDIKAKSTASFSAKVPDFANDPGDIRVRMRFMNGASLNLQQVDPALHRFTNDDGSLDIEAKIVDFQDGEVWLEKRDSKRVRVKLDRLSTAYRAVVRDWIAQNARTVRVSGGTFPGSHRWTSDSGQFDMEAKIVDYQDGVVTLERFDGGRAQVKLDFLNAGNQALG